MSDPATLPPVALLTDFGTRDAYVGTMKGVLQRECPGVPMIDLTHEIVPQNVRQAAFVLWTSYRYFPPGTVFLVVVDPGVGGRRRPLAIRAGDFRFVGPDNGVFSEALAELRDWQAVALDETLIAPGGLSATFHGRDLFAPAAARLACGQPLTTLGRPVADLITLPVPALSVTPHAFSGEIIYIDHFGNAVTSIGTCRWGADGRLTLTPRLQPDAAPVTFDPARVTLTVGGRRFTRIARTYTEVQPGSPVPLINSAGQLEIAVNQGNARKILGLAVGDRVTVLPGS